MKNSCPFCLHQRAADLIYKNGYYLKRCWECGLGYLSPMPTKKQILKLYNKSYFQKKGQLAAGYEDYEGMERVLVSEAVRKLHFVKSFSPQGFLFDMGCGTGVFLCQAQEFGYQVAGNDISIYVSTYLKKYSIPFYLGSVEKARLPKNTFSVVTAWDVFEHTPEVEKVCKALYSSLVDGGWLFLTTPDLNSIDAKILGKHWYGYKKIPEHLLFFSHDSIQRILVRCGFEVIKISPWGFERSFEFLATKLGFYSPIFSNLLLRILKILRIEKKSVYLPLTDMIVVAKKF